ncbi:MAG TPA: hypothetical protein VGF81_05120 [Solirubrobacteraceae bacterium]|jgi:hypothetical protein
MVWLSLVTWIVVLTLVLPAGGTLIPSLGLLVMLTLVGVGSTIVYGITGTSVWAWIAFGAACLAAVAGLAGTRTLVYDESVILQGVPELIKNAGALALGVALPLIAAAILISLGTAAS